MADLQALDWCLYLGMEYVTVYAFSTENFKRPSGGHAVAFPSPASLEASQSNSSRPDAYPGHLLFARKLDAEHGSPSFARAKWTL